MSAASARTPRSRWACAQRSLGPRALSALLITFALQGCTELYRWPDRLGRPRARREPAPQGYYVVKPGDTMYSIAFRHQLDFREFAAWNDVGPDFLIHPGELLRLSQPPGYARSSEPAVRTAPGPSTGAPARSTPRPPPPSRPLPPEVTTTIAWQWPTAGAVAKPFGDGGKGVDIGGALGQPVVAAGAGKVVYSGRALKGYGELIIIKHDDVHLSAYGYNRRRLVDEGATVAAGQPIAELGLGPEQKPALHFEIRKRGKPVDPAGYLPTR
jgi:lipoprotein NlpD